MEIDFAYALNDLRRFIQFVMIFVEREVRSLTDSVLGVELLVHYTAPKPMTQKYMDYWKTVDKDASLQYYSYNDCLLLIRDNFNPKSLKLFETIRPGWKKVLMFKLIMMYMKTGFVVDPNVVPTVSPDVLNNGGISTYIAVSEKESYVNMMMMANVSSRRSVLFLTLLLAFLIAEEGAFDLYSTLAYNIGTFRLESDETYSLEEVKYQVSVGSSCSGEKVVDLVWFPDDEIYEIRARTGADDARLSFYIHDCRLYAKSKDGKGWDDDAVGVDIVFFAREVLYTLSEEVDDATYEVKKDEMVLLCYELSCCDQ